MISNFYKTTMVTVFLGCWPKRCLPDTDIKLAEYTDGLAAIFERFKPETVSRVCDLRTGVVSWAKSLPTLREIEMICALAEGT